MYFVSGSLVLALSMALSLASFLNLLDQRSEITLLPALSTVGTAVLGGSMLVLAERLGWPASLAILIMAAVFGRLIYTPRSQFSFTICVGAAATLLMFGLTMSGRPGLPSPETMSVHEVGFRTVGEWREAALHVEFIPRRNSP